MRKRKPRKRILQPDPKFGDPMVTQFVNNMMVQGKKSIAYKLFYEAMDIIKEKTEENPHEIWQAAVTNVTPQVEVRSKRIGGATFQIPVELRPARRLSLGIKWIIKYTRARSGKGMAEKLAAELIAASKHEGASVKKKEDTHKMAESNRAFAHFRV
ncbi:MAG: 30S ribosomal protein S7 [Saprospiraceae bacterium]